MRAVAVQATSAFLPSPSTSTSLSPGLVCSCYRHCPSHRFGFISVVLWSGLKRDYTVDVQASVGCCESTYQTTYFSYLTLQNRYSFISVPISFVLALPLWLHMLASAHLKLTTDPRHFLTLHTLVHRLSGTLLPTFPIVSFHFVKQTHTAIHIPEIDPLNYNTRIWKVRDQYSMSASRKPDVLFCIALPSHNSQTSGALPSGKCHILIVTFLVHPHVLDGHGCGVGDGHRSR
jgi:hypothetical protein